MKITLLTIAFIIIIILGVYCFMSDTVETLRGRRRRAGRRRGGRRGGGRRWAGPGRGYVYGFRRRPRFVRRWYYPTTWFPASWYAPLSYGCKSGCTYLGNGRWGCQYPGDSITQCQFSSDCDTCGYVY